MIYFLYQAYIPNAASTNRALAYIRNLEKMRIPITVVYFMPDKDKNRITDNFQYVKVKYYWDRMYFNYKIFKYVSYYIYLLYFIFHLKKGDKVYVYGYNDICKKIVQKKGVKVFFEVTECPEVSLPCSPIYRPSLKQHFTLCKHVHALLVISSQLKNYYITKGIDETRIHIVNMIVDPKRFEGIPQEPSKTQYIAYCGAATNNKDGVDELIKAFAIVSNKYPNVNLYIIGPAPRNGDEKKNLTLVQQLGIEDKVTFTGIIPSNKVPQILKNAIVLALNRPDNKQAKYGFPTKLGEYLLTGNPVVVTNVGDIPLFLKNRESAIIVPPNSPMSFANEVCWVIEHPEEARHIGEKGKDVALGSFNAYYETKKLINIILNT